MSALKKKKKKKKKKITKYSNIPANMDGGRPLGAGGAGGGLQHPAKKSRGA